MAFKNFEELISSVGNSSNMKCAAVVWPRTENVVNAVRKAVSEGSLKAIVFGIEDELREKFSGIENIEYVDAATDIDAAKLAVKMAGEGKIDLIMKGSLETGTLLKEVVNKETGIPRMLAPDENGERKSAVMQHMMFVEIPGYHKIIGVTDGGMIIAPTLEQRISMVDSAVAMFRKLDVSRPKVACLAAVEKVNPKMAETEDAAKLKELSLEGRFGECDVEGPISTDLAFNKRAAEIKGYKSPVTGDVDIVLVPGIAAGNIMVKSLVEFAGAKTAGCILGAKVPISLTSRGATEEEEYNALMLAAAQA